jgi:hypothetical protein
MGAGKKGERILTVHPIDSICYRLSGFGFPALIEDATGLAVRRIP